MSKNRFRNELLWGLSKLLEIFQEKRDFTMVFDYVCDIEIHDDDTYEFYQVKTKKQGKSFSITEITKNNLKKKKDEKVKLSILGKLYILKHKFHGNQTIKMAIVSNAPLISGQKEFCYLEEKELIELGNEAKIICQKLQEEINTSDPECNSEVDISKMFYIHTSMDLHNPTEALLGKLVDFFEKTGRDSPKKPSVLLKILESEITKKACSESCSNNHNEVIQNKGISKKQFIDILDEYAQVIDISVQKTIKFIEEKVSDYSEQRELQIGLTKITTGLKEKNNELFNLEIKIVDYIKQNKLVGTKMDVVLQIFSAMREFFPIEYSESEIKAFILLVLSRDEEGKYE